VPFFNGNKPKTTIDIFWWQIFAKNKKLDFLDETLHFAIEKK